MDAVVCQALTKRYGSTVAVDGLDLIVPAGLIYGFLGPNGAGKTTTIRMLLGLVTPTAGRAWLLGDALPDPSVVARCGTMFEEPAFYPWMSARANLGVLAMTAGRPDRGRVAQLIDLVGLGRVGNRPVKAYSQGMRQRLGLAAALLDRPPLLVLDEPTNGLDPAGIHEIREMLRGLAAEGTTVFLSSHLLAEVEQVCDRAAVVVAGRVVEEGPVGQLGAAHRRVRVVVAPADVAAAMHLLSRWPLTSTGTGVVVDHPVGRDINGVLAAGGVVAESVSVEQAGLEERFLQLTRKEENTNVAADR